MVKTTTVAKPANSGTQAGRKANVHKKPTVKKSSKTTDAVEKLPMCEGCGKYITNDTKALSCDKCCDKETWKCIECLNITEEVYEVIASQESTALKWFCDGCNQMMLNCKNEEKDDRIGYITEMLEQLLDRSKAYEQRLETVEQVLDGKANKDSLDDLALRVEAVEHIMKYEGKHSDIEKHQESKDTIEYKDTEKNIKEIQERDKRKCNVVVFNVQESTDEDREVRIQYDSDKVQEIMTELKISTTVANPVRLGPKTTESKWPRPLRVTVENEEAKWKILKESKNLAMKGKEQFKTIFCKKDMTPMERELDAQLRKKLLEARKHEEDTGGQNKWIIWKGKVVKARRSSDN